MSSPYDQLNASPGYLLALIGAESRRRWTQALSSTGLRPAHFGVLMTLGFMNKASQRQLGDLIGVDPRNLVDVIDHLEERKLVERDVDAGDRRRHAVRLTPAGHQALAELKRAGEGAEDELLGALNAREREQLRRLLVKLLPAVRPGEKP
jgi:DNA-binding MarR family transcriptional regulator